MLNFFVPGKGRAHHWVVRLLWKVASWSWVLPDAINAIRQHIFFEPTSFVLRHPLSIPKCNMEPSTLWFLNAANGLHTWVIFASTGIYIPNIMSKIKRSPAAIPPILLFWKPVKAGKGPLMMCLIELSMFNASTSSWTPTETTSGNEWSPPTHLQVVAAQS